VVVPNSNTRPFPKESPAYAGRLYTLAPVSLRPVTVFLALLLLAGAVSAAPAGAARFYTPNYGSKTPEEIGGFDLGLDGALTPIPGSPFPAEEAGFAGIWQLAFSPDGTRAMTGFLFTGGAQAYTVPPSGIFQLAGSGIPTASVTSIAITPDGRFGYASTREFGGSAAEGILAFRFNGDGSLASIPGTGGSEEYADVAVSPDGRFLFATRANAIDRFAIGDDGSLSPLGTTPVPGAFMLATSADQRFLYVKVGTGGEPGVAVFEIGADGGLSQRGSTVRLGPGSNGDLFTVSPNGRYAFLPDGNDDLIATVAIAADGSPTILPGGMAVPNPESVAVSPDNSHLVFYRGGGSENSIGVAAIAGDGTLTRLPSELPWSTGEPERLLFQPQPTPVARLSRVAAAPEQATHLDAGASTGAARYEWDFGDGTKLTDASPTASHVYSTAGVYTVTLTALDRNGCAGTHVYNGQSTVCPGGSTAVATAVVDTLPLLGKPKVLPKKFAPKAKGSKRGGTTFRYTVNEVSSVRFKIERKSFGRLVGKKCKRSQGKKSGGRKCALFRRVGSRAQKAKVGVNKLKWNGKLKGKPLPAGSYRATVVATDAAGGRSPAKKVGFRILPLPQLR
jgi:PKD repeat protein